jgi:hypothetical protein
MTSRLVRIWLALLFMASGCGGPRPTALTGTVSLSGRPLSGGVVTLVPSLGSKPGRPVVSVIREDGTFSVQREDGGVLPGRYDVAVSYWEPPTATLRSQDIAVPLGVAKIPVRYGDHRKSGLSVTIPRTVSHAIVIELFD